MLESLQKPSLAWAEGSGPGADPARRQTLPEAASLRALLVHLGQALLLTDRQGRLLYANDWASRLLREGDALRVVSGVLTTCGSAHQRRLAAFIERRDAGEAALPPDRLVLPGRAGRCVTLRLLPGSLRALLAADAQACVALIAHDARVLGPTAAQRVRAAQAAYGWTGRETELVQHLLQGSTVTDAALAMGITTGHARQRLKEVFSKTEVRSQSQLIAVMADIA